MKRYVCRGRSRNYSPITDKKVLHIYKIRQENIPRFTFSENTTFLLYCKKVPDVTKTQLLYEN